jgi:hypothetical protein
MSNIAYAFKPTTGEYLNQVEMQESPLEPGIFLQPADSLLFAPPPLNDNQAACAINGTWEVKSDFRGTWYKPNREVVDITEIGVLPESEWTSSLPPKSIDQLKFDKNAEINAARLHANQSTFMHSGKVFACDKLSREDIDGINGRVATRGAFPDGWVGGWKAVDNTYIAITTIAQWNDFYDSMIAQGLANFAKSQSLKTSLAAATTAEQVAAITW